MIVDLPVLYSFRRCPYAMRARMGLAYSGLSYEHREISLKDRPQSLYDISSKGTVPVLQLENGHVIDESIDIIKWALAQNDPKDWYQYQKEDQDRLVEMNDNEFKKRLDKYKYHVRFPDNALEDYRNDIAKNLELYDERLLSSRYMVGEKIQLADIALMPFIRQCAHVDLFWFNENFENLSKWLTSFKESKLFISIMTKHKIWDQASEGILINWDGINQ